MKLLDVYGKDSVIREYFLDNVLVCIFMYILFYFAVWYAHKVIKKVEQKNQEMLVTVERNRWRLEDIIKLKNKRAAYEDLIIKAKNDQKMATRQLDDEMKNLSSELSSTMSKLDELENFLAKWKFWRNYTDNPPSKFANQILERFETQKDSLENIKVLEPSFPPTVPPEPPPRRFGVFARPPPLCTKSSKIGLK